MSANRGDGHGFARDVQLDLPGRYAIIRLQASFTVRGSDQGGRQADAIAIKEQFRLVEFHSRRIGKAERGVVKRDLSLQVSVARPAYGAVERPSQLDIQRQRDAHLPSDRRQRLGGKAIPTESQS